MENTIYTFTTNNKTLLNSQLSYITTSIIPLYTSEGYTAELLSTNKNSFKVLTNCPYIFNSDKIGDYTYTEEWSQNNTIVAHQNYKNGKLISAQG